MKKPLPPNRSLPETPDKSMTVREISGMLKRAGIENHEFEARVITEYVATSGNEGILQKIIEERLRRVPLQYLIGEWEFYGDTYLLNRHCLIPRPETELLTEYIIKHTPEKAVLADLCCGSGCIGISALKRRPDMTLIGIDISPDSVSASEENSAANGVGARASFYVRDIINEAPAVSKLICGCDIIACNPPYLSESDMITVRTEALEVSYEPETALYGGIDGFDFYRFIIRNFSASIILFEVGINQSGTVCSLLEDSEYKTGIIKDYSSIDRLVVGLR